MSAIEATDRFITQAFRPYYPCLLLVHTRISRLQQATRQLKQHYQWNSVSVGEALSELLLNVPPKRRTREAVNGMEAILDKAAPGPVICTDIDLLFEPSLSLDPLHLLKQTSRNVELVVLWPGAFREGVLSYGVPEHSHFRTWTQIELCDHCIVNI